jgi:protein-S-isoprenylcysteine O-methyltransferase Ste14
MGQEKKKEDLVKDLVKKVKRGDLTPKEAKAEVLRMGLHHSDYEFKHKKAIVSCTIFGALLCFLPTIAEWTGLGILNFFTQSPSITFPSIVIYAVVMIVLFLNGVGFYGLYLRIKKGGTHDEDEPIIFIREGPYAVMRHPNDFALPLFFTMFTVAASGAIPFTVLSIIGNILFLTGTAYYVTVGEDEFNLLKWGEKYRKYMKEVPRFNFILGIWRLARRKKEAR